MNLADGPNSSRKLGIMAKYWEPGRVKTRLGQSIGMHAAAAIHREFFIFLTDSLSQGNHSQCESASEIVDAEDACFVPVECSVPVGANSVDLEIVFDPPNRIADFKQTLASKVATSNWATSNWATSKGATSKGASDCSRQVWRLEEQVDGDLGRRMQRWFEHSLNGEGVQHAILIGCDCPTLTAETISRSFDLLDSHDVVIGPALDGGYYLIGLAGPFRSEHDAMFVDIPWSTETVLESTLAAASAFNLSVGMLQPRRDIDEVDDLEILLSELLESSHPRERELASRVTDAMRSTDAIDSGGQKTDGC